MTSAHMETVGLYEYDKTKVLGHGAFAVVYRGVSRVSPTQNVAVKCISKKQKASKLLSAEEINILKEVQHENVVQLFDFKETDTHLYMVMEFCNGGDLAEYLRDKGTLSEETLSIFVKQLGHAMLAIHERGVMHRDLKPGNILLSYSSCLSLIQPRDIRLKIADFGFARFLSEEDMAATLCGSPIYMAPEVLMGLQYDARVDLWSLGTIIYQCYTGKAPFKANNPYSLRSFYEKSVELVPFIPKQTSPELKHLILSLLQKNPDKRITFAKLVEHTFLHGVPVATTARATQSGFTPPYAYSPPRHQTPPCSPLHTRSPNSSSHNKLASMQRMRTNYTKQTPVKSTGLPLTDSASGSPDTEGFVVVNNKSKSSKLNSIESSFHQKSAAISSSVKTTAMAIHGYSGGKTEFSVSPSYNQSPIAHRLAIEESHNRVPDLHSRLSGRNLSNPTIRRTWSFEGQKRNRSSSESAKKSTPPIMELVSQSVKQSRRPFSANFEDSGYYNPRPLSASRIGQSAPAYFFIGGSPHTSPPSQSPLQLTFGDTSPPFTQPPELSETTIMDDYQREMLDEFQGALQYCQAIREAANLIEKPFSPTDFKDITKLQQKLTLCDKCETVLSSTIHTAKQQLFASKLAPSKTFKDVLYSIYGEFCAVHDMKTGLEKDIEALSAGVAGVVCCAEEVLLSFALQQIRSGILDENFGLVGECVKRYRLSLAIIVGLLTEVKTDHDRNILLKYENGLHMRLDNIHVRRKIV